MKQINEHKIQNNIITTIILKLKNKPKKIL